MLAVILAGLRTQRKRLLSLASTAATGGAGEAVHDTRVALRRLAAVARLSGDVPAQGDGEALRVAARDLRRELSLARTSEVSRALFVSRCARGQVRAMDAESLASEMFPDTGCITIDSAALRKITELAGDRILELRKATGSVEERRRIERRLARRVERRALRAVKRLEPRLPPHRKDIHRVRILAKHARYALEAARPFVAADERLLEAFKEFQESAGHAHDLEELETAISGAGSGHEGLRTVQAEIRAEARAAVRHARKSGGKLLAALSEWPPRKNSRIPS